MDFLLFTVSWMGFNSILAGIPVVIAMWMVKIKTLWIRLLLAIVWLAFLPNTIYLLTDVFHLIDDWRKTQLMLSILSIPLYAVLIFLGVLTFIFSLYPIDQLLKKQKNKDLRLGAIFFINSLVGIGVTMGRVERINSWELVTNMPKTLHAILAIFSSVELFLVTVLFALTANLLYFVLRKNTALIRTYRQLAAV